MLSRLAIRNFKVFDDVDIELGERVVFVGPNNSGKSSALQALALWSTGVRRWVERRGAGNVPKERAGVTINRRDLIALPIPAANLLWRNLHVREGIRGANGKVGTRNVLVDIDVEGLDAGVVWRAAIELDYANEESFYCRSKLGPDGERMEIPPAAANVRLAYLPPMSGLAANETRLDEGAIAVRIGEGRTAEVLRNLCWKAFQTGNGHWKHIVARMGELFGIRLDDPHYVAERGEITMSFRTQSGGVHLDLAASGRGQQQTLLLLAHMAANPGSVLLLDEPDAHLEILRQRQIYDLLTTIAYETGSQIIAASHSEVILNEAADRDLVIAFVGKPHRIDDRGSQVLKSLKSIGYEHYLQAEQTGWVLYLEGATDLAILRAFADKIKHAARPFLERPFVHYVANHPQDARDHFYGLRDAKPDLVGVALYDRLERLDDNPHLIQLMWHRREIENYLCSRDVLRAYADHVGREQVGDLFGASARSHMDAAIDEVTTALSTLGKPDPFGPDAKVSDEFLDPVFRKFFEKMQLPPSLMRKTDYHTLAPFVASDAIDHEVVEKLDAIVVVAQKANPGSALTDPHER